MIGLARERVNRRERGPSDCRKDSVGAVGQAVECAPRARDLGRRQDSKGAGQCDAGFLEVGLEGVELVGHGGAKLRPLLQRSHLAHLLRRGAHPDPLWQRHQHSTEGLWIIRSWSVNTFLAIAQARVQGIRGRQSARMHNAV